MKKIFPPLGILFFVLLAISPLAFKKMDSEKIHDAIDRNLRMLQSNENLILKAGSSSLFVSAPALFAINFSLARERGFFINDSLVDHVNNRIVRDWNEHHNAPVIFDEYPLTIAQEGYEAWFLAVGGVNIPFTIPGVRHFMQSDSSSFQVKALNIQILGLNKSEALKQDIRKRIAEDRLWMIQSIPKNNEERVFQLLGLVWSGSKQDMIKNFATLLISKQQVDGGWSNGDSLATSAYATGQSLFSLLESGCLIPTDSVCQKGIEFLLSIQQKNGDWKSKVTTDPNVARTRKIESTDEEQLNDLLACDWATLALLSTLKE